MTFTFISIQQFKQFSKTMIYRSSVVQGSVQSWKLHYNRIRMSLWFQQQFYKVQVYSMDWRMWAMGIKWCWEVKIFMGSLRDCPQQQKLNHKCRSSKQKKYHDESGRSRGREETQYRKSNPTPSVHLKEENHNKWDYVIYKCCKVVIGVIFL